MSYTRAKEVTEARTLLGTALEALQADSNIPDDVMSVTENLAQAVGALFEAENAGSDVDGKSSVKSAMGFLSQTMALLQNVASQHQGVGVATESLAQVMSKLYPLSQVPSIAPDARVPAATADVAVPPPASVPGAPRVVATGPREPLEANVGATTETNFFVGFSGDIGEGGVFVATYTSLPLDSGVELTVTLPGGFQSVISGTVRFVRDPMDMDSEPGVGVGFDALDDQSRDLILRFIRKRPPLFFDD